MSNGSNGSNGSQSMTSSLDSRLAACLIGAGALLALARPASAQLASAIDLSSRSTQPSANEWQSQLAVSPFMHFDHPHLALDARWTALGGESQRLDGFGNVGATYFSPTRAGMQLSLGGFADRRVLNESFAVSRIGTDARFSYRLGNSGAWLGREVARDNKSTPASPVPHYSAGGWRQWRSVIMTLSVSSFGSREGARAASTRREVRPALTGPLAPTDSQRNVRSLDTVTVVDSGSAGRQHDWRDAELGLHWSVGRLAFDGLLGTRFSATNQPNETWGQLQSTFSLGPDIALITSTGIRPASAAYGIARSRFVELGFRVSPSALRRPRLPSGVRPTAAAFQVDDAEHGTRRLRIRVPSARSVELSADFTNWQPISLRHADGDQWETTLAIAPGMHRVAIRVDGDSWTTPPGIAAVQDEFQGTVGVIVVK
jgi:hypothetical protein